MGNNIDDNSTGYIYKLCINEDDDIFYIGSTRRELRHRLAEHKYDIKNERHNKRKIKHFKDNINNLKIIELEKCFNTKEQLKFRERDYIDKFQNNINKLCPIRLDSETKLYNKIYYYKNRESILSERHKKTYCPNCGEYITKQGLNKHRRTKKCKKKLNVLICID